MRFLSFCEKILVNAFTAQPWAWAGVERRDRNWPCWPWSEASALYDAEEPPTPSQHSVDRETVRTCVARDGQHRVTATDYLRGPRTAIAWTWDPLVDGFMRETKRVRRKGDRPARKPRSRVVRGGVRA